jgi:hypothetical protein
LQEEDSPMKSIPERQGGAKGAGQAAKSSTWSPLEAALSYVRAGLSVIPIRRDGSKAPDGRLLPRLPKGENGKPVSSWDPFKERLPTEDELRQWFDRLTPPGVAVMCGKVSGNGECIDFDREAASIFPTWRELVEAECPGLIARLCIVRTPRRPDCGYHVRYRCRETVIPGNMKLASDPAALENERTLIETRGEGAYALAPGCPPECHETGRAYDHHSGPELAQVENITAAEREILLRCARSFDRTPAEDAGWKGRASSNGELLRPGDDFNLRGHAWATILGPHGWTKAKESGRVTYWRRPGKDKGWSAATGYCTSKQGVELLAVFSSNAHPFEGPTGSRACSCYSRFSAYGVLNHGGDFSAAAKALAAQGYGEPRASAAGAGESDESDESSGGRPKIVITTEEHKVNAAAAQALARDLEIYQRGGFLVRVVRDTAPAATKGIRRPFLPRIEALPQPLLRERLAANARWFTIQEKGEIAVEKPGRPPAWCVAAVLARADWPGVRHLECVVDYPIMRLDGTILIHPGYDPATDLLLAYFGLLALPLKDAPTLDDAIAARDRLFEVVVDFPFVGESHRSAWVAALLTPLARFAFNGPTPLFLVDSNVRGSGKGLLLHCISRIVTGERFVVASYSNEQEELRKRITSLAMAGDRLVLLDNIAGAFGNPVLDAALTATSWKDRVLGYNRITETPLYMTWYATGNNVQIGTDTARRTCHIRLESPEERPEERYNFRHSDLLGWIAQNRPQLLADALTILLAYHCAGRPDMGLPAWGSFEEWSRLVRSAVVWAGMPDPGQNRVQLQDSADWAADAMRGLLDCWEWMDPNRQGLTAAEVIDQLKNPPKPPKPVPAWHADMKACIEALAGRTDARALGNKLRAYRRRIFAGRFIDRCGEDHRSVKWAVFSADDFCHRPEKTRADSSHSSGSPPGGSGGTSVTSVDESVPAGPEGSSQGREVLDL